MKKESNSYLKDYLTKVYFYDGVAPEDSNWIINGMLSNYPNIVLNYDENVEILIHFVRELPPNEKYVLEVIHKAVTEQKMNVLKLFFSIAASYGEFVGIIAERFTESLICTALHSNNDFVLDLLINSIHNSVDISEESKDKIIIQIYEVAYSD